MASRQGDGLGGAVQVIAARYGWRKVRAPEGRVLDNVQRGRPQGKCHREKSARHVRVRVKG